MFTPRESAVTSAFSLDKNFKQLEVPAMSKIARVVEVFGTQKALSDALGVGPSAVSNWKRDGIPAAQRWRIMEVARLKGLPLVPEDLGLPPASAAAPKSAAA